VAVHDVEVEPRQTQLLDEADARREIGVIAGEEGRIQEWSVQRWHGANAN
jgi:hypothetical protein